MTARSHHLHRITPVREPRDERDAWAAMDETAEAQQEVRQRLQRALQDLPHWGTFGDGANVLRPAVWQDTQPMRVQPEKRPKRLTWRDGLARFKRWALSALLHIGIYCATGMLMIYAAAVMAGIPVLELLKEIAR